MEMWKSHCAFWWGVLRCGAVAGEPFILRFPTPAKSMACVHVKRKRCLFQDIIRILIFQYLVLLCSTRLGAKLFNTDEKIATQTLAHQNHLGTIPSRVQTFCHPVQLLQEREWSELIRMNLRLTPNSMAAGVDWSLEKAGLWTFLSQTLNFYCPTAGTLGESGTRRGCACTFAQVQNKNADRFTASEILIVVCSFTFLSFMGA